MESRYKTLIDLDILITQSDQIPFKRSLCFLIEPNRSAYRHEKNNGFSFYFDAIGGDVYRLPKHERI
jgi:hypothetical protein